LQFHLISQILPGISIAASAGPLLAARLRRKVPGMRVLVIEDDKASAEHVAKGLREAGMVVDVCNDGRDGLFAVANNDHDAIVLDRMLPGVDGMTILQTMRASGNRTPVLMLTALGETDDRVEGLRKGSDDYLGKPFSLMEVVARVEALGRRGGGTADSSNLSAGGIEMDLLAREVRVGGQKVRLTGLEYMLLEVLLRNAGRIVTRTMLLESVWDYRFDPQTNIVDQHVSRLRHKLQRDDFVAPIETVRGMGYRLRSE
jgi:two-component system OmpR family response regulator